MKKTNALNKQLKSLTLLVSTKIRSALSSLLVLFIFSDSANALIQQQNDVQQHRMELTNRIERVRDRLKTEKNPDDRKASEQIAQWYNWGN
jgi:hypothetical protein